MRSDRELVAQLGKAGGAFFGQRFHSLTEIQRQAIPPILAGRSVLITAATASGKTEALFAPLVARIGNTRASSSGNIRILVVAPTRALVNDLFARLEGPLDELGWQCGRQTSDHRDKGRSPDVLITTPESFDSMLVRDRCSQDGRFVDHLLAHVEGVFIDEVHLFDGTSRGDQLIWLLRRLESIRAFAAEKSLSETQGLQICGASATVSSPPDVARRLFGPSGEVVVVPGGRMLELFTGQANKWIGIDADCSVSSIRRVIYDISKEGQFLDASDLVRQALQTPLSSGEPCRKLLVFVGTRRMCDKLALDLSETLTAEREVKVWSHHGSLERVRREAAEKGFSSCRDAILVATTTLEVGVDIGDVDAVVLVGPPPNTSSLLQRIGRAGRRSGMTRIVPISRDWVERCAFASLLASATNAAVDDMPYAARWSVFVQQAASYIAQSSKRRRRRDQLVKLATEVWSESASCQKAEKVITHLCQEEILIESRGQLSLGEQWSDRLDAGGGSFHSNFESDGAGKSVVDTSTGEVIAHVQGLSGSSDTVVLGGQRWNVVTDGGEIFLQAARSRGKPETVRYTNRKAPTRFAYARHVLLGWGFQDVEMPVVEDGGQELCFHCGGSAYEMVLCQLFPACKAVSGLTGLAVTPSPSEDEIAATSADPGLIRQIVLKMPDSFASLLSPGPYHSFLPEDVRKEVTVNLFGLEQFLRWLSTRRLTTFGLGEAPYPFGLNSTLSD